MIWVITKLSEDDGTNPTFKHYSRVFGVDNIKVYRATEDDTFDFIMKDDLVISRTQDLRINTRLLDRQKKVKFGSLLESNDTIFNAHNKKMTKMVLEEYGVSVPKSFSIYEVKDGNKYFVKPMFGEESNLIDDSNICTTYEEVNAKCMEIVKGHDFPIIEEFVEGDEYTCAVINTKDGIKAYPIKLDRKLFGKNGFQTYESKVEFFHEDKDYTEMFTPINDERLKNYAIAAFKAIGATHFMRMDFRGKDTLGYMNVEFKESNGEYKCIDCNIQAGLGPYSLFPICIMKNENISYDEVIRMVFNS